MLNANDIPADVFIRSLLKAAKDRGISLVAVFGYREGGRAIMKMSSTESKEATKAALAWMFKKADVVESGDGTLDILPPEPSTTH